MKKFIILLFPLAFMMSCQDFLDEPPKSQVSPDNFYQNIDQARAGVNAIYDALQSLYSNGNNIITLGDIAGNGFHGDVTYNEHTVNPTDGILSSFWTTSYDGINRANSAIDNIPRAEGLESAKDALIGEAKYLRALFYFNLVRLFGDIPLMDHELTSLENAFPARSPIANVYSLIEADLVDAGNNLPNTQSDKGRATSPAARALLAEVYLTLGDFVGAKTEAEKVMGLGMFDMWASYEDAFKVANENGKESIFEVQYHSGLGGLGNSKAFLLPDALTDLVANGPVFRSYPVDEDLLNTYETGDQRKEVDAITEMIVNGETVVLGDEPVSIKYIDESFTVNIQDSNNNWPLRRYSDVLLMYAEAENEVNGPTTAALDAVNMVRRRA
ncbi:MAG: RagB/SusD family nutrient uptake outer membrane protein, partial [Cyclobacteriaceae bacterium]|nr:RagB/SusD family nutrient uptake outer membrane protein [Cyclobacteriaceae bacterium SS2]